jgi:uncharacterized protein
VADTNVLVSALIFPGGAPETVYRMALTGRIELASSPPLLAELGRVLTDKFGWEPGRTEDAVAQVIRIANVVEPDEAVREIHDDPDDNRVLDAAAEAGADAIVSGDRHLLRLGSWRGIQIAPPAEVIAGLDPP